jgi:predicted RNA-binding protein
MCEATVYLERDGQREKVLQDVVRITPTGTGLVLIRLLEPPKTVRGVIREIDFLKHSVTLATEAPTDEQSN